MKKEKIFKIPLRDKDKNIIDYTFVSEEDYEKAMLHSWYRHSSKKGKTIKHYARSVINKRNISLSHFILGKPEKDLIIDHIDGNGLNNIRENLRFATLSQNGQNRILDNKDTKTSKYIGVILTNSKTWRATCSIKNLGTFKEEIDAAIRYDSYVFKIYGKGARTNNLIKYEDVENIDISEFLPKKQDLPTNINYHARDKKYTAKIVYKGTKYTSAYFEKIEDAIKALNKFKEEIAKIKEQEKIKHNFQEIERNSDGIAIIKAYNNKNIVVKEALVDDDMWHELKKYKCCSDGYYCIITVNGTPILMHIYIMGRSDDGYIIDHINQIKYDNRRENLRYNDSSGNNHNQPKKVNTTSIYKGVLKIGKKWSSTIRKNNEIYVLGTYESELYAGIAYNIKAKELYGEFANLNNISQEDYDKYYEDVINIMNNIKRRDKTNDTLSIFRGVRILKNNYYNARIVKNKKTYYLGSYEFEIQAAIAYNIKAKELNDKRAKLNQIPDKDYEKYYDDIINNMKRLNVI
jgi:hypothetical protein